MKQENNYYVWNKGEDEIISSHFKTTEFTCRCDHPSCTEQKINIDLINKLEEVRIAVAIPLTITSGYRCSEKQNDLRLQGLETAKGISQHELGNAADVKCDKMWRLEEECDSRFQAMGVARSFIHVDTRPGPPIRRWKYS